MLLKRITYAFASVQCINVAHYLKWLNELVIIIADARVFFTYRNTSSRYNMLDKLEHIFKKLGLDTSIAHGDRVMINTPMGL